MNGRSNQLVSILHTDAHRAIATYLIPPTDDAPEEEWDIYRSFAQAGWRDNEHGVFAPGMRLDPEALSRFGFSQTLVEDIRMGYEYALSCTPPEFEKRNYLSFTENAAPARADIDRLLKAGFIEGP